MSQINQLLPPENILLDLDASSKKRVFEQAGLLFENNQGIASSTVFDSLFAREKLGSTGLGRGIANAVNLLDVDVVVVGGGVARAGDIWWNAVLESVEESVIPWCSPVSVRRSELGEHGGIWGGAAMVLLAQVE